MAKKVRETDFRATCIDDRRRCWTDPYVNRALLSAESRPEFRHDCRM